MNWKTTWSYMPLDYSCTIGTLENITQKTTFWNNINGKKVKLKFSNKYGTSPLTMKEVVLGQKEKDSCEITSHINVTLNHESIISVLPGQEIYSDEIEFDVRAGTDLVLSIYFEEKVQVQVSCCTWSKESWHTSYMLEGNHTIVENRDQVQSFEVFPFIDKYMSQADVLVGVSEIRLLTEEDVKTITLFGDSITHMSYYSDALMRVLYREFPGKVAILNKGIGGNKVLTDASYLPDIPGNGRSSGQSALKRFQADVFGTEIPDYIFILEGVNDLMHPYLLEKLNMLPRKEDLVSAYTKFADIAHQKGSKIYFSTILPLKHEMTAFGSEGEKIRIEVNEWIRKQNLADGLFDFAIATSKDQESMKDDLHIGDGLHPNIEGGIIMAQEVLIVGGIENGIITD